MYLCLEIPYVHNWWCIFSCSLWIRIHPIHVFLGLLDPDPDPDPLVRGMIPDPDPDLDPSNIKQK